MKDINIPKELFNSEKYIGMSINSKLAYGFLSDEVGFEFDKRESEEFIYSDRSLSETLSVSTKTANRLKQELVSHGLLKMKRQGKTSENVLMVYPPEQLNAERQEETGISEPRDL